MDVESTRDLLVMGISEGESEYVLMVADHDDIHVPKESWTEDVEVDDFTQTLPTTYVIHCKGNTVQGRFPPAE